MVSKLELRDHTIQRGMATTHQTLRGRFAAKLLCDHITKQINIRIQRNDLQAELPQFSGLQQPQHKSPSDGSFQEPLKKVCIVGAGAAGMYLAWMLSHLNVEYDLLEASDHMGGHVFTHKFAKDSKCAHNYVDIGAMRIPDIDSNQVQGTLQP
jgi:NADPH-dependent 2,4-dienoyl-CoA reductase/sulfur reductase-like enzyme